MEIQFLDMNLHFYTDESTRGLPSKTAKRVKMHYDQKSVTEYVDYVINRFPSRRIAIVGEYSALGCEHAHMLMR